MQLITGFLTLFLVLLTVALVLNAPLILLVLLGRRRLDRRVPRVVLACGFGAATAYSIWRMEWFDVWRPGVPPLGYMVQAFGPYTLAVAVVGWFIGSLLTPRARHTHA